MSVLCAWASQDENKKIKGGKSGDQTGLEVRTGSIYNFGQTKVVRCNDRTIGQKIGNAAKMMALNDLVGYDQNERTAVFTLLKSGGWNLSSITKACETDCSELAVCAVNVAYGRELLTSSLYSGNIVDALIKTGLFTLLTDSKYLGKSEYIMNGDIIVKPGSHVIIAYSDGSNVENATKVQTVTATTTSANGLSVNSIIAQGQRHAINFTGINIVVDGKIGSETNKMKARVLQRAMNADYGNTIKEDGVFGSQSKAKLGSHYIVLGEKQYMVTAAEILMMLQGIDPNGVECPGKFGTGLAIAAKKFNGSVNKLDANSFLALIK